MMIKATIFSSFELDLVSIKTKIGMLISKLQSFFFFFSSTSSFFTTA